jgi:hypothetical protein
MTIDTAHYMQQSLQFSSHIEVLTFISYQFELYNFQKLY